MSVCISFDGLSGVDGSARFSFGNISAIASVSGPVAARLAAEHPARATVEVHVRPLSSIPGTAEKHTAIALRGIIERACILSQHPRSLIQVVVQALSPPSSSSRSAHPGASPRAGFDMEAEVLLAAEINACSLALLNAGSIPLRGVVCAVVVSSASGGQPHIVAPGSGGTDGTEIVGSFAFLFGIDSSPVGDAGPVTHSPLPPSKMVWTNYHASPGCTLSTIELEKAEKVASAGAATVWAKMKKSMESSFFSNKLS